VFKIYSQITTRRQDAIIFDVQVLFKLAMINILVHE